MDVIKTQWPEVNTYLAAELSKDPYIRWHLNPGRWYKPTLYVCGQCEARNVMKCSDETPRGLQVWLEAQDDDARVLLFNLPINKELFVDMGTPLGLELVQEELTGVVKGGSLFCIVDRHRFRPALIHPVKILGQEDRDALQRYPTSMNRDAFFGLFNEGKINLYGCYEKGEIVGYATSLFSDTVAWVHVRPEFRGQGYGRSLLSSCTMELLKEHDMVFYNACMENMAHLRVCLAVGFAPLRQTFFFEGRRN